MHRFGLALLLTTSVLLLAPDALAVPVLRVQMEGEPGEWVGQCLNYDLIYDDSLSLLQVQPMSGVAPNYSAFHITSVFNPAGVPSLWLIFATGESGGPLAPGHYDAVYGSGPPGQPRLAISIDGRSPASPFQIAYGSFTVREISWDQASPRLLSLDLDFEQFSHGSPAALRGRIEYNASGPASIPESSTALSMLFGLVRLGWRRSEPAEQTRGREPSRQATSMRLFHLFF